MPKLNSKAVESIFLDCLFRDGEDTSNHVAVEGITMTVGFNPDRLMNHKSEIVAMLAELPDSFKVSGGGGMSFLAACDDKHGNQWTSFHQRMEQLFQLGLAVGAVKLLLPKEVWHVFPGGMPYYAVL